ncbi:hypothetical protein SAMN05421881_11323 [Nitrosomonas halophila]|uniref:Uncharacterized protein n=1 Tax=Nitrosomonas halophila TaxID=44576 RepID=A0A1H3Q5K2_9PROT|nr:hypothetical protein SAMN05421881_11323 [Nitrosomonas halophila]
MLQPTTECLVICLYDPEIMLYFTLRLTQRQRI